MHAVVGDEVVIDTETLDVPRRRGRVLAVSTTDGREHYRVGWSDGRESLLFPGPDVHVVHHRARPEPVPQPVGRLLGPDDPVRSIMSTPVSEVDGQASLRHVAEVLTAARVGALIVVDGDRTVGVVSERDVVRALAQGGDPDVVWAADVVAAETVWGRPADSIRSVASRMWEAEVRHIPLKEDGKAVGIVSIRDVLDVLFRAWDRPVHPVPDI
jgi:CBS domain-containing protein